MKAWTDPSSCPHSRKEARRKLNVAGKWFTRVQCLDCGRGLEGGTLNMLSPVFDDELEKSGYEFRSRQYEQEREAKARAWWAAYNAHLRSEAWKKKREAVLRRNPMCQACLSRPSVQAHHLTYKHVGDEPLFELVGVCVECHEKITRMDREVK